MNIVLVIATLNGGGAERVMSIMANYWIDHGKDIVLITMDSKENDFYMLDPRVKRVGLCLMGESRNLWESVKNNWIRLINLRTAIKENKPKVVISFVDRMNIITLMALLGTRIKVVVSERIDPRWHTIGVVWSWMRRWLYPSADAVVLQSAAVRDNWAAEFISKKRLHVIPNPVLPETGLAARETGFEDKIPFIVSMGRLVPQKGFNDLLKAFYEYYRSNKNWSLVILGQGPQQEYLKAYARELGIESNVYLPGRVKEPRSIIKQAEFYVLSSKYEGFPNALLEAMSCGLPVISFDCPSGPSDIISHGENGLLVPSGDIEGLVTAMKRLVGNKSERYKMGNCAHKVLEKYSVENVMKLWDYLIGEVEKN